MTTLIDDLKTICDWLGWGCHDQYDQYHTTILWLRVVDGDGDAEEVDVEDTSDDPLFWLTAFKILAAVNARGGDRPGQSKLLMCVYGEAVCLRNHALPPDPCGYCEYYQIDNTSSASIATAIIRLAAERARWEEKTWTQK